MKLETSIDIQATRKTVWDIITDIDGAVERIRGIEKVEVLERPESGLIGLKWRETRTMFGKTATEVMWITDVMDQQMYRTRAENHGAIYISELSIRGDDGNVTLTMSFGAEVQSFFAKIMSTIFGFLFKGATIKAIQEDLEDIKAAAEAKSN